MFQDSLEKVTSAAKAKNNLLESNIFGYFVASLLAGIFIGFGVLISMTVGGLLIESDFMKIMMGASFAVALSLVIMSGSELFTGNVFVLGVAGIQKKLSLKKIVKLLVFCYIGNWIGSVIIAYMHMGTGLINGQTANLINSLALTKTQTSFLPLLLRSILCNILVCIAVWSSIKMKSESGKLIMVFWCIFTFFTLGFEHSVANMTLLTLDLLQPIPGINFMDYFYNLSVVTLGNIIGGLLFVSFPYVLIGRIEE